MTIAEVTKEIRPTFAPADIPPRAGGPDRADRPREPESSSFFEDLVPLEPPELLERVDPAGDGATGFMTGAGAEETGFMTGAATGCIDGGATGRMTGATDGGATGLATGGTVGGTFGGTVGGTIGGIMGGIMGGTIGGLRGGTPPPPNFRSPPSDGRSAMALLLRKPASLADA